MKGISPVYATLLLILITMISGMSVYSFITMGAGRAAPQSPGSIIIDTAILYDDRTVDIYVRNISSKPVEITALTILKDGEIVEHQTDPTTFPVIIPPGSVTYFSPASASGPGITVGELYTVKVVAADGSSASIVVRCKS